MYYITANRNSHLDLYIYHAVADPPGVDWNVQGPIQGNRSQWDDIGELGVDPEGITDIFPFASEEGQNFLDTPSPIYIDGQIHLYFLGGADRALYLTKSSDGHNFSKPERLNAPYAHARIVSGRVSYIEGAYYYVYSIADEQHKPPTQMKVAKSLDGENFYDTDLEFDVDSNGSWDSQYLSSGILVNENNRLRLYYSGTSIQGDHWAGGMNIGYYDLYNVGPNDMKTNIYKFESLGDPDTILTPSESFRTHLNNQPEWEYKGIVGKHHTQNYSYSVPLYELWDNSNLIIYIYLV